MVSDLKVRCAGYPNKIPFGNLINPQPIANDRFEMPTIRRMPGASEKIPRRARKVSFSQGFPLRPKMRRSQSPKFPKFGNARRFTVQIRKSGDNRPKAQKSKYLCIQEAAARGASENDRNMPRFAPKSKKRWVRIGSICLSRRAMSLFDVDRSSMGGGNPHHRPKLAYS